MPPKAPRSTAAQVFARQVRDAWGVQPIFLDASDLAPKGALHSLDDIAMEARVLHLSIVPATRLTYGKPYQDAVARMVAADGAGVALRISSAEMGHATAWASAWQFLRAQLIDYHLADDVAHVAALGVTGGFVCSVAQRRRLALRYAGWWCIRNTCRNPTFRLGLSFSSAELVLFNTLNAHGLPYHLNFGTTVAFLRLRRRTLTTPSRSTRILAAFPSSFSKA